MLKTLITLMRGSAARADEELTDRAALLILDQQIRDAATSLEAARKALALAMAGDRQEMTRIEGFDARIADLEPRVLAALDAGDEASSREGAETIARLESDRDAARASRTLFAKEIARLKAHVADAENRMAELDRGRRSARAAEAVRRLRRGRMEEAGLHRATLSEAEATLARLRQRQSELTDAEDALDQLSRETAPAGVAERLAARGYGPALRTTADDVIARLKRRTA
jgi:phage shock protein A